MPDDQAKSFGARIAELTRLHPDRAAIVFSPQHGADTEIDWRRLDEESNRLARMMADRGARVSTMIVVSLPNSVEHYLAAIAAWKLGACILPLNPKMPVKEREQLLDIAKPSLIVGVPGEARRPHLSAEELNMRTGFSAEPLPNCVSRPGKAIASGGSTGRPKIIVDPSPWAKKPGQWPEAIGSSLGMRSAQTQLVAGPLYHNGAFVWSHMGLFEDHSLVLMERFDAARFLDLLERYRVNFGFLVPTMMQRIARVPGVEARDFSSVQGFFHAGAPCPPWLKRKWFDLIGAEKLYEMYGATEGVGFTIIRGDEWLQHPGSVGRPYNSELRILDGEGRELPPGETGEIFTRFAFASILNYEYLGAAPAKTTPDGFVSVGDMGWVDQNGYLFLADRRTDLILSGGANIYPAEVEAALTEHAEIADVAVVGIPDEEWGRTVHAIVQPVEMGTPPSVGDLDRYCRERLTAYKVPKSYEFIERLPRNEAGKLRRSDLAKEREHASKSNMIRVERANRERSNA
jgi:bile acid-coenzyme A ligase